MKPQYTVKQTISQNLGPLIHELKHLLTKTARGAVSKRRVFLRRQPRYFANVTLVARRRKHFRVFLAIFVMPLPSKKEMF